MNYEERIGLIFGKWTIINFNGIDNKYNRLYTCKCECGTIKIHRWTTLSIGKSLQCESCQHSIGKNLTGSRFGRWLVDEKIYIESRKEYYYQCICDCGNKKNIPGSILKSGKSNGCISCGNNLAHYKYDALRRNVMHKTHYAMIDRCYNEKNSNYKNYGGRGIIVCDRWKNSFENFLVDMGEKPVGLSIDRIDNDGNYEPSNCKWSSVKDQANNRRTSLKNRS